jgi:hypothetical protein
MRKQSSSLATKRTDTYPQKNAILKLETALHFIANLQADTELQWSSRYFGGMLPHGVLRKITTKAGM